MLRALGSVSRHIPQETKGTVVYGHWALRLVMLSRDKGYDLLRALGSASCGITYELGGTICYERWVLRLVTSLTRQGIRFLPVIGFCDCDIMHQTGRTISYGHWVLRLVISDTRQEVRFITVIGFCVLWYHIRDRGYELLRASDSTSYNITYEAGPTICYEHWILCLVISHTR